MAKTTDPGVRELARRAKHRITSGYYAKDAEAQRKARRRTLTDKVTYDKIVEIVARDGTVTDVIARLVDGVAFDRASETERERLVLGAAATYRKVKGELARQKSAALN